MSLVQKTLFKWGEYDFLNRLYIRLIGGRFNNFFDFKSYVSSDLKYTF